MKFLGWRLKIWITSEVTRKIYLNCERSEQQKTVVARGFNQLWYIGTIKMSIGTNYWESETYRNKFDKNSYHRIISQIGWCSISQMIQNPSVSCSIPPNDWRRYSLKIRHCSRGSFQEKDSVMLGVQTESSQCEFIEGLSKLAHCTKCPEEKWYLAWGLSKFLWNLFRVSTWNWC